MFFIWIGQRNISTSINQIVQVHVLPVDFIYFAEVIILGWNEEVAGMICIVSDVNIFFVFFFRSCSYLYILYDWVHRTVLISSCCFHNSLNLKTSRTTTRNAYVIMINELKNIWSIWVIMLSRDEEIADGNELFRIKIGRGYMWKMINRSDRRIPNFRRRLWLSVLYSLSR